MKAKMTDGLHLEAISIALNGRVLLSLSAEIRPGDILTVMGPSGSGKSALLAHLGGFLDPAFAASGRIRIDGDDLTGIAAEKRRCGMLFQDPLLFPHLSVGGNLLFGLTPSIVKRDQRRRMVEQALADVELEGFLIGIRPRSRVDRKPGWRCSASCYRRRGFFCWTSPSLSSIAACGNRPAA